MKTTHNWLTLALIGSVIVLGLAAWQPRDAARAAETPAAASAPLGRNGAQTSAQADCATGRSVQVSGAAVINVTPDRALLQLGVESNGDTPDGTRQSNSQQIERVIAAVRALGVEQKDIATDYYIVYPVYQDYNALQIKGYRIDNTVSITVRDVSKAGDVIVAALKAGANQVQDVQFYTSELRKYRDQARSLAMQAAHEKAQALAEAGGAQAGCVLSISENSWTQYYGGWWQSGRQATLWAQNVMQNAAPSQAQSSAQSDDSPVSLEQIAVRAEVSASYSLK